MTLAPSVWKMRLVLTFCSPQTIWTPNNPTHMFQIWKKVSRARVMSGGRARLGERFGRCLAKASLRCVKADRNRPFTPRARWAAVATTIPRSGIWRSSRGFRPPRSRARSTTIPSISTRTKQRIWALARERDYPFRRYMPSGPIGSEGSIAIVTPRTHGRPLPLSQPLLPRIAREHRRGGARIAAATSPSATPSPPATTTSSPRPPPAAPTA